MLSGIPGINDTKRDLVGIYFMTLCEKYYVEPISYTRLSAILRRTEIPSKEKKKIYFI